MQFNKTIDTSFSISNKLSFTDGEAFSGDDSTHYRSFVGALQYITLTRSDIAFLVNKVCQFLHAPTVVHWTVVKHILRYLHGTISLRLWLSNSFSTVVQMIGDLHVTLMCMLDQILFYGMPESKPRYSGSV
jgi:hypothetical protein